MPQDSINDRPIESFDIQLNGSSQQLHKWDLVSNFQACQNPLKRHKLTHLMWIDFPVLFFSLQAGRKDLTHRHESTNDVFHWHRVFICCASKSNNVSGGKSYVSMCRGGGGGNLGLSIKSFLPACREKTNTGKTFHMTQVDLQTLGGTWDTWKFYTKSHHREPRQWMWMCWKKTFLFASAINSNLSYCLSFVIFVWWISANLGDWGGFAVTRHCETSEIVEICHFEQHKWQKPSNKISLSLFRTQIQIFYFNTFTSIASRLPVISLTYTRMPRTINCTRQISCAFSWCMQMVPALSTFNFYSVPVWKMKNADFRKYFEKNAKLAKIIYMYSVPWLCLAQLFRLQWATGCQDAPSLGSYSSWKLD